MSELPVKNWCAWPECGCTQDEQRRGEAICDSVRAQYQVAVAAPELLDALQFALVALHKIDNPIFTQRYAITKANAAIAKATGDQS